jgi:heat shock protein HslJ
MSMFKSAGALLLAGALCLGLAASVSAADPSASPGASAGEGSSIEGVEWMLAQQAVKGTLGDVDSSVHATLLLEDGQASGSGGCNRFSGSYSLEGSSLVFGPFLSTLMACDDPAGSTEKAYFVNLAAVSSYASDGSTLTLSDGNGNEVLKYTAVEPGTGIGNWLVTGYRNATGGVTTPVVGSILSIDVGADGTLAGSAGCNRYFGSFTVSGSTLTVGPLASTKMACASDDLNTQETNFLAALEASTGWTVDSSGLTLTGPDGTTVTAVAAGNEGYIGSWEATGINNGQQAVVSPAAGVPVTATFTATGEVHGNTGCNSFSGPYTVVGDSISIGPLASTLMACANPVLMDQEQWYLSALQGATTWQTDPHGLSLRGASDELLVQYVPATLLP